MTLPLESEDPMPRHRGDADRGERRKTLIAAADALLLAQPYQRVRVEDIARAAGVAKGTVFLYFPNKESLALAVLHARLVDAMARLADRVAGVRSEPDLVRVIGEAAEEAREVVRMLPTYWAVIEPAAPADEVAAFRRSMALALHAVAHRAAETWSAPIEEIRTAIAHNGLLRVVSEVSGLRAVGAGPSWFAGESLD